MATLHGVLRLNHMGRKLEECSECNEHCKRKDNQRSLRRRLAFPSQSGAKHLTSAPCPDTCPAQHALEHDEKHDSSGDEEHKSYDCPWRDVNAFFPSDLFS